MDEIKEKLRKVDRVAIQIVERAHPKLHRLEPHGVCWGRNCSTLLEYKYSGVVEGIVGHEAGEVSRGQSLRW